MSSKRILLIDMDGVLVAEPSPEVINECLGYLLSDTDHIDPPEHWSDIPGIFSRLEPMKGSIEAYSRLYTLFEGNVYICSTAPWGNPSAWTDKRLWVEKWIPLAHKKLILTHNKNLVNGDFIIDDRTKNGVSEFKGVHIHFGTERFPNWLAVLEYFENKIFIN